MVDAEETQGGKFRGAAVGSTAGFSYAAQVVELVRVAATVRAEMDERAAAAPQAGADQALLEMLSKLPIGSGAKQ